MTLYFLLCGELPFWEQTYEDTIKKIQKGQYKLDTDALKLVSNEAKDLIRRMMTYNVNDRISADDALQHPWMLKAQKGDLKGKDLGNTLNNLRTFTAGGRLKQALLGFFTTRLMSQAELNRLAEEFKIFDQSGDGYLSFEELKEAMSVVKGIDLNEQELREIIKKLDADDNGRINYSEFLMVSMNREQLLTNERLEQAFKMFDKNGDNEVSVEELHSMFENVKGVDERMIERAMNEVDRKGKRSLKFNEFKIMMERLFDN